MATDRARNSYDPTRLYRSVVAQQGRVTVEADNNEAERIRAEASRGELIDIIGRVGSPDDGFKITAGSPHPMNFAIHAGTIYVGGVRIDALQDFTFANQPDWLDRWALWRVPTGAFDELAYLEVTEREVTAVEDPALREVALGGPDTAARTRMQPRVKRVGGGGTCEVAFARALAQQYPNSTFVPDTMALVSNAKLKVAFSTAPSDIDPCLPIARSGFLGPENQLVRVQVTNDGGLLWGWDNASFLFRGTVTGTRTVRVQGVPVDVFHDPKPGHWVEVLEIAATAGEAQLAASFGQPCQLAAYDRPTKTFELRTDLTITRARDVYVRIWRDRLALPADDKTALDLVQTGVQIYIQNKPVAGDYWMIGLRPSTPQIVYPKRFLDAFQPPDGPARWVAPLAKLAWNAEHDKVDIHDCRPPFEPLTELTRGRCCELLVHPGTSAEDVERAIQLRLARNRLLGVTGLHLKFASGNFTFERTIHVAAKSGDLTVSGCGATTTLRTANFEAVLAMQGWNTVAVHDLTVHGGKPTATGPNNHLNGALTFHSCDAVDVERVLATCSHGKQRAATCITVLNGVEEPGRVRVRGCELVVGLHQTALLVVNSSRATIEDNHVSLPDLIKIGPAEANTGDLRRLLYDSIRIVSADAPPLTGLAEDREEVRVRLGGEAGELRFATYKDLGQPWRDALQPLTDLSGTTAAIRRAAEMRVDAVRAQLLSSVAGPLSSGLRRSFTSFFDARRPKMLVAAGQGIVVGGQVAGDVRILNNTVMGVMEGIRVGLSNRRQQGDAKLLQVRDLLITGNTVRLNIPAGARGNHAGIFVGNVRYAAIRDNRVLIGDEDTTVIDGNPPDGGDDDTHRARRTDGIRVWGMLGEKIAIEGNVTDHTRIPILLKALNNKPFHAGWWITRNVSIDALFRIEAPDANDPNGDIPGNT